MVDSTQAQNEIHPIVYKFPSIPPFHTQSQIKAALALHRLPLEQGCFSPLCSNLTRSRCRETHSSLRAGFVNLPLPWAQWAGWDYADYAL